MPNNDAYFASYWLLGVELLFTAEKKEQMELCIP